MTDKKYFVTHDCGHCHCDSISREKKDGTFEDLTYQDIVDRLNKSEDEIKRLRKELLNEMRVYTNLDDDFDINKEVIDGIIDKISDNGYQSYPNDILSRRKYNCSDKI